MSSTKYDKLQLDGVEYKTTFTKKWMNRKPWTEPNPNLIEAHIPGTILSINVKEGQEVQAEDGLLSIFMASITIRVSPRFT